MMNIANRRLLIRVFTRKYSPPRPHRISRAQLNHNKRRLKRLPKTAVEGSPVIAGEKLEFNILFPRLNSLSTAGKEDEDDEGKDNNNNNNNNNNSWYEPRDDIVLLDCHLDQSDRIKHALAGLSAFPQSPKLLLLQCEDSGANDYLRLLLHKAIDGEKNGLVEVTFRDLMSAFHTANSQHKSVGNERSSAEDEDDDDEDDDNDDEDDSDDDDDDRVVSVDASSIHQLMQGLGKALQAARESGNDPLSPREAFIMAAGGEFSGVVDSPALPVISQRQLTTIIRQLFEHCRKRSDDSRPIILHFSDLSALPIDSRHINRLIKMISVESAKHPNVVSVVSLTPPPPKSLLPISGSIANPNNNINNSKLAQSGRGVNVEQPSQLSSSRIHGGQHTLAICVSSPSMLSSSKPSLSPLAAREQLTKALVEWQRIMHNGRISRLFARNQINCETVCQQMGLTLTPPPPTLPFSPPNNANAIDILSKQLLPHPAIRQALTVAYGQTLLLGDKKQTSVPLSSFLDALCTQIPSLAVTHLSDAKQVDIGREPLSTELNLDEKSLNSYEKRLLPTIVPAAATRVRFRDIAALAKTKETLQTLIALPLLRPSMFQYGVLRDSVSGVLLFGPPGTGKTMLAKAVAAECGSNFMSITASVIYNMYVGEGEKNAKAIFTLARKLAPCVIFIDELDSIFDARDSSRSFATKREVINEFMAEWDGVASRNSGIIVVGATNRPFDLDDAVLRRLPRRLMIDLPNQAERERILRLQLADEKLADDVDIGRLADRTAAYSGSDLKNVCMTAALQAVREQLQKELMSMTTAADEPTLVDDNGLLKVLPEENDSPQKRLLTAKHFEQALAEVSSSVHEDQESLERLRRWNDMFGDGNRQSKSNARRLGFHHVS